MYKFITSIGKIFVSTIFVIGCFISQGACVSLYYQPDMPPELAKKFQ